MRHWLCFRASGNPLLIPPPNLDGWTVAREAQQQARSKNADRKTELAAEKVRLLRARMSVAMLAMPPSEQYVYQRAVIPSGAASGIEPRDETGRDERS